MPVVGIDSVLITQKIERALLRSSLRKGLIGVGVEVKDENKFKKNYKEAIEKTFESYGKKCKRPVYCANKLLQLLEASQNKKEFEPLENFKKHILPAVDKIHFFYTYIFGLRGRQVSIFGNSKDYTQIPLISQENNQQDFYDLISNSYPLVCAWELKKRGMNLKMLLDNFQGRVCPAWEEATGADITTYYKGDQCNELISTADIFVKILKFKMIPNEFCFSDKEVNKMLNSVFKKKHKKYFIGKKCLKSITPHQPRQINSKNLVKKPIIYLVKEDPKDEDEETIIENSPLFDKVVKKTHSLDGCFKYYHPKDTKEIAEGALLASFGKRGETTFKKLENLKYPIKKFP